MRIVEWRRAFSRALLGLALCAAAGSSTAASQILYDTAIAAVAVNGGQDSTNPGTTCVRVTSTVSAACVSGYVAILNNNKQLVATALLSKASASRVDLYYVDDTASSHCPGFVFTPCAVISIQAR